MASVGHIAVGLAIARWWNGREGTKPRLATSMAALSVLAMLPDLDVVTFALDADAIVAGELRDAESARAAIAAANDGRLVLGAISARDVGAATARLLAWSDRAELESALRLVVAQRLCRRICRLCRRVHQLDCRWCRGSGYRGRVAIHEVLALEDGHAFLQGDASAESLERAAIAHGMRPLGADGVFKAERGDTDYAELESALIPLARA